MKLGKLPPHGKIPDKIAEYLGGYFSFTEQLKLGGTGSVRFVYELGIEAFDDIKKLSSGLDFVSIELLREGLVFRLNKQSQFRFCALRYEELRQIDFITEKTTHLSGSSKQTTYEASICFNLRESLFKLRLTTCHYKKGLAFFHKSPIEEYCNFSTVKKIDFSNKDYTLLSLLIYFLFGGD